MQHLVVHDVLDRVARHPGIVEDAAYHDSVMRGIVVSQGVASGIAAPRHVGATQQTVEVACIQFVKNAFEVVVSAAWRSDVLAPAQFADKMNFSGDMVASGISAVTKNVASIQRLAIDLG